MKMKYFIVSFFILNLLFANIILGDNKNSEKVKKREEIKEKIITLSKGYIEIGTYNLNDSIHKKTRNNYKKINLKKGDKIIVKHVGTNYDGILKIEILRENKIIEVIEYNITETQMPIYSIKEFN